MANLISASLMSTVLCTGVAEASLAQGGWRQWEVRLRDGRRLEANPLGAPDDAHLSLSVGAYDGRGGRIARSLVDVVAALPVPDSLSAAPVFAAPDSASTTCQRQESWHQPDLMYPIGSQQAPALCFGYCRT